jgi:hypothetical protein
MYRVHTQVHGKAVGYGAVGPSRMSAALAKLARRGLKMLPNGEMTRPSVHAKSHAHVEQSDGKHNENENCLLHVMCCYLYGGLQATRAYHCSLTYIQTRECVSLIRQTTPYGNEIYMCTPVILL